MRKKLLLLINSSQVLMDITKRILERAGYSVQCAVGLAGARERFMDFMPDGILLDNDLPDGKGIDYCRELRKEITIPIMIFSNVREDEVSALQAGANDFLKKPYDLDVMMERLKIMLKTNPVFSETEEENSEFESAWVEKKSEHPQQNHQIIRMKDTSEPKRWRMPKIKRWYVNTAACLIFLIGIGIYIGNYARLNQNDYIDIPETHPPLSALPFQTEENAEPYTEKYSNIIFHSINNAALSANTADVKILLLNPKENSCYFIFEIIFTDTGELLYSSGMIEPGMCIREITLSKKLAKGVYNANIKILAYSFETFAEVGNASMDFYLTAY